MAEKEDAEQTLTEPTDPEKTSTDSFWKKHYLRLRFRLHARFPNHLKHPLRDETAYTKKRDKEENEKSRVPDAASVRLASIQIAEIFSPNEIDRFYEGLGCLKSHSGAFGGNHETPGNWVKEQRQYGYRGRYSLGSIRRPEDVKGFLGTRYTADVPSFFESIQIEIHQLSPSITCVLFNFIFTDEYSNIYKREINKDKKTTYIPLGWGKGYRIIDVINQKQDAIDNLRLCIKSKAVEWVSKNFAGFFTKNCSIKDHPMTEFLVIKNTELFEKDKIEDINDWRRFLYIDNYIDYWFNKEKSGLYVSFSVGRIDKTFNHSIIVLKSDTEYQIQNRKEFNYSEKLSSHVYHINMSIDKFISKRIFIMFLREVLKKYKIFLQDSFPENKKADTHSTMNVITQNLRETIGISTIAKHAVEAADYGKERTWGKSGFIEQTVFPSREEPRDLTEMLQFQTGSLANELVDRDHDSREFFSQMSSVVSARESLIAQKRSETLTLIAIIIAVISLIYTVFFGK